MTPASEQPRSPEPGNEAQASSSPSRPLPKEISDFLSARIELASIEASEAAEYAARQTAHGISVALCAFFTWTLLLAGLTGILAPFADQWLHGKLDNIPGWAAILIVLSGLHALAALLFFGQLKKKPATRLFDLTRNEFQRDKQWLKKNS